MIQINTIEPTEALVGNRRVRSETDRATERVSYCVHSEVLKSRWSWDQITSAGINQPRQGSKVVCSGETQYPSQLHRPTSQSALVRSLTPRNNKNAPQTYFVVSSRAQNKYKTLLTERKTLITKPMLPPKHHRAMQTGRSVSIRIACLSPVYFTSRRVNGPSLFAAPWLRPGVAAAISCNPEATCCTFCISSPLFM